MSEQSPHTFAICKLLTAISSMRLLGALIVAYLFFVLYVFPNSGFDSNVGPLDLEFSYSPETAYSMIESYGEEGRSRYAISAMTVDVAYPLVYTLLFMVWITLALKGTSLSANWQCIVTCLPLSVLVLDLLENSGIVILLKSWPTRHNTLVAATSLVTSAKWSAAGFVILVTLLTTADACRRWLRSR